MKGKLTFSFIQSRTGRRWRVSVSRNFLACMLLLGVLLAGAGVWGALRYGENQELKQKCTALQVERSKYEAISRRVQTIEKDQAAVRKLLGLQVSAGDDQRPLGEDDHGLDDTD